jgi:hypothetical protein
MRNVLCAFAAASLIVASAGSAEAGSTGRCGGSHATPHSKTLTCPSGQYVAALTVRGALYVDQFSIACRSIPVSGEPGDIGTFKSAGPGGGVLSETESCVVGSAVTRVKVNSGVYVDKIKSVTCHPREGTGWASRRGEILDISIGGPGGGFCGFSCPDGEALYQVTVKYGDWIDSIRGSCRR